MWCKTGKDKVDNENIYFSSVLKEFMRLLPISGDLFRSVNKIFVMECMHIPKGW